MGMLTSSSAAARVASARRLQLKLHPQLLQLPLLPLDLLELIPRLGDLSLPPKILEQRLALLAVHGLVDGFSDLVRQWDSKLIPSMRPPAAPIIIEKTGPGFCGCTSFSYVLLND